MAKEINFLPKEIPKYKARVLGEEDREFYEEVFSKTAEKYGRNSLAYKNIINGINPEEVTGSNFLFNTEAGLYLKEGSKVLTLEDIDNILATDKNFFNGFYTDTNQLVLRNNKDSYEKNQLIINYLIKELKSSGYEFSPENPLVITNPELVPDKKSPNEGYGLIAKLGKDTKLRNDKRLASGKNKINLGNLEKGLYTKDNGLSRVYLSRGGGLNVGGDVLELSSGNGRVVAVSDAEGVAPKILEEYATDQKALKELKKEQKILSEEMKKYKTQIEKINKKYQETLDLLRG